ncbi:hypothetical protein V865_006924 [Kwoniella europaea PYCC6329]|uniref:AN1-type domain-containing protein n=1 Tax=Kwoniella europaea PYCC6329 TaxID=1423913 RepID=A0AAX4KQU4_9TREE
MAFQNCSIPNCIYQALTWSFDCPICHSGHCFQHRNHPLHECWVAEQRGVWKGSTLDAMNEPEMKWKQSVLDIQ